MSNTKTLEEIAEARALFTKFDIEYARKLVSNQPEYFTKTNGEQVPICQNCQDKYSVDGLYSYIGKSTCKTCGKIGLCSSIRPKYMLGAAQ